MKRNLDSKPFKYYTCSQSWIPDSVITANARLLSKEHPTVNGFATLAEARKNIGQDQPHNIILEDNGKGLLQIYLALWDS